jgi:adenine specific DNA methylase Mod
MRNALYYGDNLQVPREHIPSESVDLVYLDPPYNSNASYNVLFRERTGEESPAQIKAFTDTWEWTQETEYTFEVDIIQNPAVPSAVKDMVTAFRQFIGRNSMMAYLVMMATRLVELHRVLKPTGSLYLHCDPTASHYLKILLDAVFGSKNFRNEISWKRYGAHNDVGQGSTRFGRVHDLILIYGKSDSVKWNQEFVPLDESYIQRTYRFTDEDTGRRFTTTPLTGPGGAEKGNPVFEWNGHVRAWRYNQETIPRRVSGSSSSRCMDGYLFIIWFEF